MLRPSSFPYRAKRCSVGPLPGVTRRSSTSEKYTPLGARTIFLIETTSRSPSERSRVKTIPSTPGRRRASRAVSMGKAVRRTSFSARER
jgi:hypothetical protein